MNGNDFIIFYEEYAKFRLAQYWGISPDVITHLSKINASSDYDLLFGEIKIDVKTSSPVVVKKNRTPIWDFSLRKVKNRKRKGQNNECDYFLLVGMKNGIPNSVYLVPSVEAPTNHIRIPLTKTSKYEKYKMTDKATNPPLCIQEYRGVGVYLTTNLHKTFSK